MKLEQLARFPATVDLLWDGVIVQAHKRDEDRRGEEGKWKGECEERTMEQRNKEEVEMRRKTTGGTPDVGEGEHLEQDGKKERGNLLYAIGRNCLDPQAIDGQGWLPVQTKPYPAMEPGSDLGDDLLYDRERSCLEGPWPPAELLVG